MTEPDWEAIAGQLAREVLNLMRWVDEWGAEWWGAYKYDAHIRVDSWQPHLDIGQAMKVLDTLGAKGLDSRIQQYADQRRPIVQLSDGWEAWVGADDSLPEAICAAAKSWADAQKGGAAERLGMNTQ